MCSGVQPAEAVNQGEVFDVDAEICCVNILDRPPPPTATNHPNCCVLLIPTQTRSLLWPSADATARTGQVRSHVSVSASCWPLFRSQEGPGAFRWLHSFSLSSVRHAVDHSDSIWALVVNTHLFPVYVSPTGGVSDLFCDDVSCDLTCQIWKG